MFLCISVRIRWAVWAFSVVGMSETGAKRHRRFATSWVCDSNRASNLWESGEMVGIVLTFLIYVGLLGIALWLAWRFVTAHERMAAAQEKSADALIEISRKQGTQT